MVNTYFSEGSAKVAVQSASWCSVFKGKIEDPEVEMYQFDDGRRNLGLVLERFEGPLSCTTWGSIEHFSSLPIY